MVCVEEELCERGRVAKMSRVENGVKGSHDNIIPITWSRNTNTIILINSDGYCIILVLVRVMALSRFAYVRDFELPDQLLPGTFILLRIDGHAFHKCPLPNAPVHSTQCSS